MIFQFIVLFMLFYLFLFYTFRTSGNDDLIAIKYSKVLQGCLRVTNRLPVPEKNSRFYFFVITQIICFK